MHLQTEPIDVLLTDVRLPGQSGNDLAVEALRLRPGLRVVFASGMDSVPGLEDEGPLARAILLQKPYSEAELAKALAP